MKNPVYILEIYEPGSQDDVKVEYQSPSPFMGIQKGELLAPLYADGYPDEAGVVQGTALRVVEVHHLLWSTKTEVKQKAMIFTELEEFNGPSMTMLGED